MSMASWHNYGYGVCTSKIETTADKLKAYIDNHKKLKSDFIRYIADSEKLTDINEYGEIEIDMEKTEKSYENYSLDELIELYADYSDFGEGLNGIIQQAITEETGIPLISCTDYNNDENFAIMPSYYPWEVIGNNALMSIKSENDIKIIFAENIKALTDQSMDDLDWGEQQVEGWG